MGKLDHVGYSVFFKYIGIVFQNFSKQIRKYWIQYRLADGKR